MKRYARKLILVIGICLCAYPFFASFFVQKQQSKTVATYQNRVGEAGEDELDKEIEEARSYNDKLYRTNSSPVTSGTKTEPEIKSYENILNLSGNGIMATLQIPKIDVNLPIYHGTSDEILSVGVGHLEGSSVPIGGKNTHSVMTGHRGLPTSKLFTRLDELEAGDVFYVQVLNETLSYQIRDIKVILPEEMDCLQIEPGKDMVSLVTCTPYGINSHRLVVTGTRILSKDVPKSGTEKELPSLREIVFVILPLVLVVLVVIRYFKERRSESAKKK